MFVSALAFACVLAIVGIVKTHERKNAAFTAKHSARSAALAGVFIALGDLQTYAGTDRCATAEIDRERAPGWLGVWHGSRVLKEFPERVALVSNRGLFADATHCRLRDPADPAATVDVPWERIGENARIAFFVRDESLRASVKKRERAEHLERFKNSPETLLRLRQQIPRRADLSAFFENQNFDAPALLEKISRAPDAEIFFDALDEFHGDSAHAAKIRAALTAEARGVPADPTNARLKIDLSDSDALANFSSEEKKFVSVAALENLRAPADKKISEGVPVAVAPVAADPAAQGFFEHPFPLVTELKIHFGFFNPRSDGQHRARFHITARFWNPYSFPLLAHGDGRLGLFDAENLPPICIENLNTGAEILFSPTSFPVGRFGIVRQTPSDKTCNAYARIFDATDQGFGADGASAGLHGGEVFLARFPDPRAQPAGLARNVGGSSWKFKKGANAVKPPSGLKTPGAWFHAAHKIRIGSLPSLFTSTLVVRGDAGSLGQQTFPEMYSEPVFIFKNVSFPSFSLEMSGDEYNRQLAGDHDISRASLVWKIRLRAEDATAMAGLLAAVDPRAGVFDFSVPAVRNAFEISTLVGDAARAEAALDGATATLAENVSPLRDRFVNEHATNIADAFSCIKIFDTPRAPVLSVGALRHFAYASLPPAASFGAPVASVSETKARAEKFSPNEIFDRFYFSADGQNPHHAATLVSGAFNVNSANADAWRAVLAHDIPAWTRIGSANSKTLRRAFFTLPHSAHAALPGALSSVKFFDDAEFSSLSESERERVATLQSAREIRSGTLKNFAEKIVELLDARRARGEKPFLSLAEFADSGTLADALRASNFNAPAGEEIPAWFPAAVSQAALMESLAPCAFTRGDTFTVFCRAETFDPISKKMLGAACAELRVQRMTEFFDKTQNAETPESEQNALNRAFGRRFKIISFRYIPHDEL